MAVLVEKRREVVRYLQYVVVSRLIVYCLPPGGKKINVFFLCSNRTTYSTVHTYATFIHTNKRYKAKKYDEMDSVSHGFGRVPTKDKYRLQYDTTDISSSILVLVGPSGPFAFQADDSSSTIHHTSINNFFLMLKTNMHPRKSLSRPTKKHRRENDV